MPAIPLEMGMVLVSTSCTQGCGPFTELWPDAMEVFPTHSVQQDFGLTDCLSRAYFGTSSPKQRKFRHTV